MIFDKTALYAKRIRFFYLFDSQLVVLEKQMLEAEIGMKIGSCEKSSEDQDQILNCSVSEMKLTIIKAGYLTFSFIFPVLTTSKSFQVKISLTDVKLFDINEDTVANSTKFSRY